MYLQFATLACLWKQKSTTLTILRPRTIFAQRTKRGRGTKGNCRRRTIISLRPLMMRGCQIANYANSNEDLICGKGKGRRKSLFFTQCQERRALKIITSTKEKVPRKCLSGAVALCTQGAVKICRLCVQCPKVLSGSS